MDQETAKRRFVQQLLLLARTFDQEEEDELDPVTDELDRISEHLWGCHDVVLAPPEALEEISEEPVVTYHQAVLHRALAHLVDGSNLTDEEMVQDLRDLFLKDQAGHGRREVDRATFHAWLRTHVREAEGIIDADMEA